MHHATNPHTIDTYMSITAYGKNTGTALNQAEEKESVTDDGKILYTIDLDNSDDRTILQNTSVIKILSVFRIIRYLWKMRNVPTIRV